MAGIELQKAHRDITSGDVDGFIDPQFIKWRNLHHILLSEKITTNGHRDSDRLFTIEVGKLFPSRASLWKNFKQSPVFVQTYFPVLATVQNIKGVIQTKPIENSNSRLTYVEGPEEITVGPLDYSSTGIIPPLFANLKIVNFNGTSGRVQLESSVTLPDPLPDLINGMIYRPILIDGKPLGLMEPVVDNWIRQHGNPLGGFKAEQSSDESTVDAVLDAFKTKDDIEQPSDGFMQHLRSMEGQFVPGYTSRIVGLYEGAQFGKEMYRPSGACKMRNPHNDHGIGMGSSAFCPVCQYLITHRIDPSKHFIDTRLHQSLCRIRSQI